MDSEPHAEPNHRFSRPTHYWPKDSEPKEPRLGLKASSVAVSPLVINNQSNGQDCCRVY